MHTGLKIRRAYIREHYTHTYVYHNKSPRAYRPRGDMLYNGNVRAYVRSVYNVCTCVCVTNAARVNVVFRSFVHYYYYYYYTIAVRYYISVRAAC